MSFVDEIECVLASGRGGDGLVSFLRQPHLPRGGPDGGDGGRGGALIVETTTRKNTLQDFRRNANYHAKNGQPGGARNMTGRSGEDLVLTVPVGTVIHHAETDEVIADLDVEGARWVMPGGSGGQGNIHFKSSTMRTPRIATPGQPGTEVHVRLELKLIADVGLLGFPNAGKSTLISSVSNARPKVASYPFTTLVPNLGVVQYGDDETLVIADIPGLIDGAAEGAGLGHQFLRHVERCNAYLHLVSCEDFDEAPAERLRRLDGELTRWRNQLGKRPQIVVLTKVDLLPREARKEALDALRAVAGERKVMAISSVTRDGLRDLVHAVVRLLQQ
jgi:GTPase